MGIKDFLSKRAKKVTQSEGEIIRILSGEMSQAGIQVDQDNAFQVTAVKSAVSRISEFVATLPLKLYRKAGEKGKEEVTDHPLSRIVSKQPNPMMTSYVWRETAELQCLLYGNHMSQLVRDRLGRIIQIVPLSAGQTHIKDADGKIMFHYQKPDGGVRVFSQEEIFHIQWFSFNAIQGEDPIYQARDAFGLSLGLEKYASDYLANEASPSGILQMKGTLRNEEARRRLKEDWRQKQGRWGRKNGVAVLEQGMEWQSIANTPRESQLVEERKYQVAEVARWFNIPAHLVGDLEHATFSNVEEQTREFVLYTMMPWLVRWEQAMDTQLLTQAEQQDMFFKFSVQALLRGDAKSRAEYYASGKQWGWLSSNDIRQLEDMNQLDEGGNIYLQPLNMVDVENPEPAPVVQERQEERQTREDREARKRQQFAFSMQDAFADAWRRVVKAEVQDVSKAVRNNFKTKPIVRDANAFERFMDNYYSTHGRVIRERTGSLYQALFSYVREMLIDDTGVPLTDDEVRKFTEEYFTNLIYDYNSSSQGQLLSLVRDAEIADKDVQQVLLERLSQWEERRPSKLAKMETFQAVNALTATTFAVAGTISAVRWVTFGKTCPYCSTMRNKRIPVNTQFAGDGEEIQSADNDGKVMRVYRRMKHPPLHRGCDCGLAPV